MNILLADDDKVSCALLRRILESEAGNTVTVASNGEEAWELLSNAAQPFDLGLFDIVMPILNGIELLERIRAAPALKTLRVILCTAANDRHTVEKARLLAVSHYIVKPYTKTLVFEKLRLLEAERTEQPSVENRAIIANRLGVDEKPLADLGATLISELNDWLAAARQARQAGDFERLALQANGLKGASLNLGFGALSRELEALEARFARDYSAERLRVFPPSMSEVAGESDAIRHELMNVRAQLQPPA